MAAVDEWASVSGERGELVGKAHGCTGKRVRRVGQLRRARGSSVGRPSRASRVGEHEGRKWRMAWASTPGEACRRVRRVSGASGLGKWPVLLGQGFFFRILDYKSHFGAYFELILKGKCRIPPCLGLCMLS